MKGDRMGVYECSGCNERCNYYLSDSFAFAGEFRPAAVLEFEGHPMYWRDES